MANFFAYPFAIAGDKTTVPNTGNDLGPINYQYGWGTNYDLTLGVDADALPISRNQTNQLFYDVTSALQQYQSVGTPDFIPSGQTVDGDPYPYNLYARVRYPAGDGGLLYESQIDTNTNTPGTDNTWLLISGDNTGIKPGMVLPYAGITAPAGYLLCNGQTPLRASYGALLAALTFTQTAVVSNSSVTITGLSDTTKMYIGEVLEGAGIQANTTIVTIPTSTSITVSLMPTVSSSPTTPLTFFPYGNGNGSTTFTVPNAVDTVIAGAGGTLLGAAGASGVGLSGGDATYMMQNSDIASHVHAPTNGLVNFLGQKSGGLTETGFGGTASDTADNTGDITPTRAQTAMPIVQPTILMNYIIKT